MRLSLVTLAVLGLATTLTACGGSGSSTSPSEGGSPTLAPSIEPSVAPSTEPSIAPSLAPTPQPDTVSIKIKPIPDNGGDIIITPAKSEYQIGETITIEARARAGFLFNGYSSDQLQTSELVVSQGLDLTAEFVEDSQTVVEISTNEQLHQAFKEANQQGGHTLLLLADGDYQLNSTFVVDAPNITLRGQSGDRSKVRIAGPQYNNMFLVRDSHFKIEYVTIGGAPLRDSGFVRNHIVQIQGERNADYFSLRHSRIIDSQEQMIKVSKDASTPDVASDFGLIEHNLFEFTTGQALWWYTGGIDAHRSHNWVVRNNTFKNIHNNNPKPGENTALTEGAIHFWADSKGSLIENNVIINCDRGIMLGLDSSGHADGIIRNNFIMTNKDVGIYLAQASNTQVYNNTIWLNSSYPNAIEYRFSESVNNHIANNLTNGLIRQRNNGQANVEFNVTNAQSDWFINAVAGDLHLAKAIDTVVGKGTPLEGVTTDIDGQTRDTNAPDIGADEAPF
ncbi:right-handed parallel beta-helix repeat-containing protein [Motilimonas sp. KMU-193]|uniref:right-handed parallel beta-helix repeat-containing protein n=1 Tax=Motilimonas sp. KMU-193 TaxID=3388668 RepID=UPI00396B44BA